MPRRSSGYILDGYMWLSEDRIINFRPPIETIILPKIVKKIDVVIPVAPKDIFKLPICYN